MKPHEEAWWSRLETNCHHSIRIEKPDTRGPIVAEFREHDDNDGARALLACQAPAMARLLLSRVDNSDSGKDSVDWYCFACHMGGGHAPDCALIATLHAAGVR